MTANPNTLLKFANLQMAAEALFSFRDGQIDANKPPGSTQSYLQIDSADLKFGDNRSSRFTDVQAAEFAANWQVVEHKQHPTPGSGLALQHRGLSN